MRRVMNVGELKRYYEGRSLRRILFCTEDQAWDKVENPLKARLAFTSMMMACHPNVICLKNGDSVLYLWCEENDLLSPIYTTAARGGCWFCHNQGVEQLRLLRKNYPDLWALLLKWDADSPITFHPRGRTVAHFETRFQMEDDGKLVAGDKRFRWAQVLPNLRKDNIHENYPES